MVLITDGVPSPKTTCNTTRTIISLDLTKLGQRNGAAERSLCIVLGLWNVEE